MIANAFLLSWYKVPEKENTTILNLRGPMTKNLRARHPRSEAKFPVD